MNCLNCSKPIQLCLCNADLSHEETHDDYLEDLDELRAMKTKGANRCLACYFFNCRCLKGLKGKTK